MMRKLFYLGFMVLFLAISSCSKDLGNYDYNAVNELQIQGLLEGDHHTSRIYNLAIKDTLKLNPKITGTASAADTSNMDFEWIVNEQVVSRSSSLRYVAVNDYGKLPASFTVVDRQTGLKTSYNFFVNVVNSYKLGYYVLSKKANADAILYCRSTVKGDADIEEVLLPGIASIGKNPLYLTGNKVYGASATDYHNEIVLAVKDAEFPVLVLDSREFSAMYKYNAQSYTGGGDFIFSPTQVFKSPHSIGIFAVNNGKVHVLQKGAISTPRMGDDPLDYQLDPGGFADPVGYGAYFLSFYDSKNKRLRVADFSPNYVQYDYPNISDHIIPADLLEGQQFLYGTSTMGSELCYLYLAQKGNTLNAYKLLFNDSFLPSTMSLHAQGSLPAVGEIKKLYFEARENTWYLAMGRTIYKAASLGLDFQKFLTLPDDQSGDISDFQYNISANRILISTFDAGHSSEKKSSIYIYDTSTSTLTHADKYCVEEVVGLLVGI